MTGGEPPCWKNSIDQHLNTYVFWCWSMNKGETTQYNHSQGRVLYVTSGDIDVAYFYHRKHIMFIQIGRTRH